MFTLLKKCHASTWQNELVVLSFKNVCCLASRKEKCIQKQCTMGTRDAIIDKRPPHGLFELPQVTTVEPWYVELGKVLSTASVSR